MGVTSTGRHSEDARSQPVPSVDLCPILQEDVSDGEVTEPGSRRETQGLEYVQLQI